LSTHLRRGLPSGLFPSGFPTNILYAFLFSIRAQVLICYRRSQIFEVCHILRLSVTYLYVMILPCSLVTRQHHFR
jgi:hypothetical protein